MLYKYMYIYRGFYGNSKLITQLADAKEDRSPVVSNSILFEPNQFEPTPATQHSRTGDHRFYGAY